MYDQERVRTFYDAYANWEWSRLEASAYGRLQAIIHGDFIQRYVKPGDRVLDAGCGPGRFSILATQVGATVTCLDVSAVQLSIAREKLAEAGIAARDGQFVEADICDLSQFDPGAFDVTICFGGALSYVCESRKKAANELLRVTRRGGVVMVSVMCLPGSALNILPIPEMLQDPDNTRYGTPGFFEILASGDMMDAYSRRVPLRQPPMHLYRELELRSLFGCTILETAGSNVTIRPSTPDLESLAANPGAWATIVELERKLCTDPGMVDSGNHIILAARK